MASSVTAAQLHAVIADIGPQVVADAVTRSSKLYDMIQHVDASDPKGVVWQARGTANTSAAAFTPGGSLPSPSASTLARAYLPWGNYASLVSFNSKQLLQIPMVAGTERYLVDMTMEQLEECARSLKTVINTDSISGNATDKIVGICTAIDDTGTYAEVDRASVTAWACYVAANSGSGRNLTVSIMDTAFDSFVNTKMGNTENMVILTSNTQESVMRGFSTGAVTPAPQVIVGPDGNLPYGVPKVLSHARIFFRDIPVVAIPGYTAGRVDFVSLDGLRFEHMTGAANRFVVAPPEIDGDNTVFKIYSYCQLRLRSSLDAFSIQDLN